MRESRLSNFAGDLKKARQQALLIEVLRNDFQSWEDESEDTFWTVSNLCSAIFDTDTPKGKTNVLVVGSDNSQPTISLFGSLLSSLGDEFSDLHRRELLGKLAAFGLTKSLGAGVSSTVTETLNVGAEKMMDYVAELAGGATDYLSLIADMITDEITEEANNLLKTIGKVGAEAIAGQFSSKDEFYLSRLAAKKFKKIAPRLSGQATSHEALQLALEMLLVVSHGAPKVIIINDPFRLDDASLALLSMLVALEKDLQHVGPNSKDGEAQVRTTGISVVLAFTGAQPQERSSASISVDKQEAVSRLRMMAARYNLLERLDSDIPVPAVRSSTFVGRAKERDQISEGWRLTCEVADNIDQPIRWCLIKGEPGTGKTSLANYFIQQVRSDADNPARLSIPVLRMLNQTGHNAQATGLASLKNSMAEELRRLSMVYQENVGWFSRIGKGLVDSTKEYVTDAVSDDSEARKRTLTRAGKLVAELAGISAAVGMAQTAKSWKNQGKTLLANEKSFGESFKGNYKEEQYELMRKALEEMVNLAHKCLPKNKHKSKQKPTPLLLLVDDLQWIDDFTAEFMLNEWPASVPVFIISTARGSDSFTTTGESESRQAANQHRNRLFSELGLIDSPPGTSELGEKESDMTATQIFLKGMDQPMLSELIRLTYADITPEEAEQFAEGTIRNLSVDLDSSEVVTLFAVETLNVISDPQFYRRNPGLLQLIERAFGSQHYRFRPPTDTSLSAAMDDAFDKLKKAYEASYAAQESGDVVKFSLASFAVLEERLHLIEQYFGEYGGTARYSLMFSALLGSPFQNELVQHVIETLQHLKPEDHPDLAPFLTELQRATRAGFRPEAYELLEQAYEIVRRLDEGASVGGKYVHQHSLLKQFLRGQFTQIIESVYPKTTDLDKGIRALVYRIKEVGEAWFAEQEKSVKGDPIKTEALAEEDWRFSVALTDYWYRLMIGKTSELGDWAEEYSSCLNNMAAALKTHGRPEKSLPLDEEALSICRQGYTSSPERWAGDYVSALNDLARTYHELGIPYQAKQLDQEAVEVCRKAYKSSPSRWADSYGRSLNSLAHSLNSLGRPDEALPLEEEALSIVREHYDTSSTFAVRDYATSLANLALTYDDLGRHDEAYPLLKEALSIRREGYESWPEVWAEDYAVGLSNLAGHFRNIECFYEALPLFKEALTISKEGYRDSPDRWAESYSASLNSVASVLALLKRPEEALPLQEESVSIRRKGYESSPGRWGKGYVRSLGNLAAILSRMRRADEALSLREEAISICRLGYETSPELWINDYADALVQLMQLYERVDCPEEAFALLEDAVRIHRKGYESSPEVWAETYATLLNNLALESQELGEEDKALRMLQEALRIRRSGYQSSPHYWAEDFAASLNNLARVYEDSGQAYKAIQYFKEARKVHREGFKIDPEHWREDYVIALNGLAASLRTVGSPSKAVPYHDKALELCRTGYRICAEGWAEDYANSLRNKAMTKVELGQRDVARALYQEADAIPGGS